MGNAKQDPEQEALEQKERAAWQREKNDLKDDAPAVDQLPKGLRSQGTVDIVPANAPKSHPGMGKRSEPTRRDAMETEGQERPAGYDTRMTQGPTQALDKRAGSKRPSHFAKEAPELEPMAAPEIPDLKGVTLDTERELQHSSDEAKIERTEQADDESESEQFGEQKQRDAKALGEDGSDAEEAKG